jgi:hypothetical protein
MCHSCIALHESPGRDFPVLCVECGSKSHFVIVSSRSRRIGYVIGPSAAENEEEADPDHVLRNSNDCHYQTGD